jgi:hypothetical protein
MQLAPPTVMPESNKGVTVSGDATGCTSVTLIQSISPYNPIGPIVDSKDTVTDAAYHYSQFFPTESGKTYDYVVQPPASAGTVMAQSDPTTYP